MIAVVPAEEAVARFGVAVARRLGLRFDDAQRPRLAEVLERRAAESDAGSREAYLARLEVAHPGAEEVRALARELTVGETYFFRNAEQFRALVEVVLPERIAARSATRKLALLSAGCASGEEAYTLAILLRERLGAPSWDVAITGVDVNPAALERAAAGSYSPWSLRETPADVQRRWFRTCRGEHVIDESLRSAVRFQEHNLTDDDPALWAPGTFDVVFCRNVLMYLTPEIARAAVERIGRALVPGGYLFLGHAETLRGLSQDFHLRHTHATFYHQRRDGLSSQAERSTPSAPPLPMPAADAALSQLDSGWGWVDAVRAASERIAELSERRGAPDETETPAPSPRPAPAPPDTRRAIALLQRERFSEALALLGDLPREAARDADVLLLRAVLLTHSGQLAAAEAVCAELRGIDDSSAGAYYLLALCREGAGDRAGAIEHDQTAAYLDPGFAMPHLHLGLMARRAGDLRVARQELEEARVLLAREDASRILLFGGGFTREALMHLCGAELRAVGGER